MSSFRLITLTSFTDDRGTLSVAQWPEDLPFKVERFFTVRDVPNSSPRGQHAHRECHQLLVCLAGSVKAMVDDGFTREVFTLTQDSSSLYMPPMTWGTQFDYSSDAVLLVLASHPYDPLDYVHDFGVFTALVKSIVPASS